MLQGDSIQTDTVVMQDVMLADTDTTLTGDEFLLLDNISYTETQASEQGIVGKPISYSIATDNLMTSVLILCLVVTVVIFSTLKRFLAETVKLFFFDKENNDRGSILTSTELRCQLFMALETCLMYAILYFLYLKTYIAENVTINQDQLIGLFCGVLVAFFLLKSIITSAVNLVFFDRKQNKRFLQTTLFLLACEGLFLIPIVYLPVYFDLPLQQSLIYVMCVIVVFRLLTIYKQRQIFFKQKGSLMGFFLYLCTLEIAPFFVLWNVMIFISESLMINY